MGSVEKFLLEGEKADLFSIKEVAEHGCSGGLIPSLIYYVDIKTFYEEHEEWIWQQASQYAADAGYSVLEYLSRLGGANQTESMTGLKQLLTWWACEVAAQYILNEREEQDA